LMNLFEVAREIANRLTRIFLRDQAGRRPVFSLIFLVSRAHAP
jgi:hypothetical protein